MIKRITNPEEFKRVVEDLAVLHEEDIVERGHYFIRHNKESIIENIAHTQTLAWNVFVWAHHNGERWDAIILFSNDRNPMFGVKMFSEHLWLSKNPKVGYKLLRTALRFAKENEYEVVSISCVEKNPSSKKLKEFYPKLGFRKDSETYLAKL